MRIRAKHKKSDKIVIAQVNNVAEFKQLNPSFIDIEAI
jgi:hypothetical protein